MSRASFDRGHEIVDGRQQRQHQPRGLRTGGDQVEGHRAAAPLGLFQQQPAALAVEGLQEAGAAQMQDRRVEDLVVEARRNVEMVRGAAHVQGRALAVRPDVQDRRRGRNAVEPLHGGDVDAQPVHRAEDEIGLLVVADGADGQAVQAELGGVDHHAPGGARDGELIFRFSSAQTPEVVELEGALRLTVPLRLQ